MQGSTSQHSQIDVSTGNMASHSISSREATDVAKVLFVTPEKTPNDPEQDQEIMYASDDSVALSSITHGGDSGR